MKSKQIQKIQETEIGEIPEDWRIDELQKISKVIDSAHITPRYSTIGFPMIRVTNIKLGFLDLKDSFKVTSEIYEEFTKNHKPRKNDIVMGRVGTYGITSFVNTDEPFCLGQNTIVIHSPISRFIYYALNSKTVKNQIEERVGGSTQKTISLADIRELLIVMPTHREEIKRIEKILFDLDLKISTLRIQNQTLEKIIQIIFKSWFIDFDGQTEFVDSELGKIPKGWKITTLESICDIIMGQSPPGTTYNTTGEGIIFYQGVTDFGNFFPTPRMYCTKPKRFAEKNDVLITIRAPVGSVNVSNEKCCIGRGLAALRLKENHGPFLLYLLKSLVWESFEAEGTVFGAINKKDLEGLKIIQYPIPRIKDFNMITQFMFYKIWKNTEGINILSNLRNMLLPKLMSGEIRV